MHREEIITNIQNKLNKAYMLKDRDKVDDIISVVFDEVEKLRRQSTLGEFFGWEENAVYEIYGYLYRIVNGQLYSQVKGAKNGWRLANLYLSDNVIRDLREAKKYVIYYYIKHKWIGNAYLKYNPETEEYFMAQFENYKKCKKKFTQTEINEIMQTFNTRLDDFELIKVE